MPISRAGKNKVRGGNTPKKPKGVPKGTGSC